MNTNSTRRSAAALALSALVTLGILGGIQSLAVQPADDALMAMRAAQPQAANSAVTPQVKS